MGDDILMQMLANAKALLYVVRSKRGAELGSDGVVQAAGPYQNTLAGHAEALEASRVLHERDPDHDYDVVLDVTGLEVLV
jgi:hypothetical protein